MNDDNQPPFYVNLNADQLAYIQGLNDASYPGIRPVLFTLGLSCCSVGLLLQSDFKVVNSSLVITPRPKPGED